MRNHLLITIIIGSIAWLSLGGRTVPQQCTRIKVPKSDNFPLVINGKRSVPPTAYSAAFKPLLSAVELPEGYRAVGGGGDYVIACTP